MPKLKSHVLSVEINGKPVASVGVRRNGNGAVIIGFHSHEAKRREPGKLLQSVSAGALEVDRRGTYFHRHYLESTELAVGDVVTVRVLKSGKVSVPTSCTKETKRQRERNRAIHEGKKPPRE
jgi:hypothetical protein